MAGGLAPVAGRSARGVCVCVCGGGRVPAWVTPRPILFSGYYFDHFKSDIQSSKSEPDFAKSAPVSVSGSLILFRKKIKPVATPYLTPDYDLSCDYDLSLPFLNLADPRLYFA